MKKSIFITGIFFLVVTILKAQSWGTLGLGLGDYSRAIKSINGKLFVAGGFNQAGSYNTKGIASFDGMQWDSVGVGICGDVYDILMYENELYAGGGISWPGACLSGPINEHGIVRWNNSIWYPVGNSGTQNGADEVRALTIYNGELYIAGHFGNVGGINTVCIAKWNGTAWSAITACPAAGFDIYCMTIYKNEIYIGGGFGLNCISGNTNSYNIARWNGTQWDSVGGPANGLVTAMVVDTLNNYLYVGGAMNSIAGLPVKAVAKWDGTNWTSPGGMGITNGATSMCFFNGELYVGGYDNSDTVLARFNGTNWYQVKGPNYTVTALGVYDSNLYVGGYFDSVLTMKANHIACYGNNCPQGVGVNELQKESLKFNVFPNPSKEEINIEITGSQGQNKSEKYIVKIKNSLGQEIFQQQFYTQLKIDTSQFPKGICLVEVCTSEGKLCHTEKVVVQ